MFKIESLSVDNLLTNLCNSFKWSRSTLQDYVISMPRLWNYYRKFFSISFITFTRSYRLLREFLFQMFLIEIARPIVNLGMPKFEIFINYFM